MPLATARRRRADEPWFADAFAALERVAGGHGNESDWSAIAPFAYGRWDMTAQDHHSAGEQQINERAAAHVGAEGAFDPPATKAQLRKYSGPVSIIAGEVDVNSPLPAVRELAASFSNARLVVIPGAAHFPWLDEPGLFADAFNSRMTRSTHHQAPKGATV
jgi:proline iminopeptidase